jgi:hypothetical protein
MTMILRRVWRSRIRTAETPWPRWRLLPAVSLYWRRRRAALRSLLRVARITETRVATPVTALSVHQHFHRPPRIVRVHLPASLQAVSRVTERLLRERWRGARPLDDAPVSVLAPRPETVVGSEPRAPRAHRVPDSPQQMAPPRRSDRLASGAGDMSRSVRPLTARGQAVRRTDPAGASPAESPAAPRVHARPVGQPVHGVTMVARRPPMTTPALRTHRSRMVAAPVDVPAAPERPGTRQVAAVPLDWRTPPPSALERARPGASKGVNADSSAASSRSPGVSTPSAHGSTGARDNTASALLDASVVDRLADTVIQRIERRVRIERERRGL